MEGHGCLRGAVNLYKCTLEPGQQPPNTACTQGDWINLTHVYGCNPGPLGAPAHVHPDQHGIAFLEVGERRPGTSRMTAGSAGRWMDIPG